jgi:hypothetical protein
MLRETGWPVPDSDDPEATSRLIEQWIEDIVTRYFTSRR